MGDTKRKYLRYITITINNYYQFEKMQLVANENIKESKSN